MEPPFDFSEWVNRWVHIDTGEPCVWMTPELEAAVDAAYDEDMADDD